MAQLPFRTILVPRRVEMVNTSRNELMAFNFEKAEHSQQDGFSVGKLAEELPFSVANGHKQERNYLSIPKVVVPSACPVPVVAPQNLVQFEVYLP